MSETLRASPVNTLGIQLRQARRRLGMTQAELAQPEFTKSYVSAVERGRVRPSPKALEVMARRLGLDVNDLLTATLTLPPDPDRQALDEDIAYQLDHVKMLLHTHQEEDALALITTIATASQDQLDQVSTLTQYRFYRLRALVQVRLGNPAQARSDLERALVLAEETGDPQEVARTHNALGVVYYEQELPHLGIGEHLTALRAVQEGAVKDLTLRTSIYRNLANDYWALHDVPHTISMYKEALGLLEDINDTERQAGVYWGLSLAYRAAGDLTRAKLFGARALTLYDLLENWAYTGQMCDNLALILIERQEYAEAEQFLNRARVVLEPTGDAALLSILNQHYALLELGRDQLALARLYAQRALDLGRAAGTARRNADTLSHRDALRAEVGALRVAGLVEERNGHPATADALFNDALALINEQGPADLLGEVETTYADILRERGAHAESAAHYRAALQAHQRQRRQ
jgi:tetratricopeptide (TPR) repeat protein